MTGLSGMIMTGVIVGFRAGFRLGLGGRRRGRGHRGWSLGGSVGGVFCFDGSQLLRRQCIGARVHSGLADRRRSVIVGAVVMSGGSAGSGGRLGGLVAGVIVHVGHRAA